PLWPPAFPDRRPSELHGGGCGGVLPSWRHWWRGTVPRRDVCHCAAGGALPDASAHRGIDACSGGWLLRELWPRGPGDRVLLAIHDGGCRGVFSSWVEF